MRDAMKLVPVVALTLGLVTACESEPAKNPPPATAAPAPAPAAPVAAANADGGEPKKPKMVANPDGLSLADRMAKREAAEKKLANELATEENSRLLAYDKTKLPLHQQTFAAIQKFRAGYDKAKT